MVVRVVIVLLIASTFLLWQWSGSQPKQPAPVCFDRPAIHPLLRQYLIELQESTEPATGIWLHSATQGFGVQFISYYAALSEALRHNSPLFFRPQEGQKWNYATPQCITEGKFWNCFFQETGRSHTEFPLDHRSVRRLYSTFLPPVNTYFETENHQQPKTSFKQRLSERVAPTFHNWTAMLQPPLWAETLGGPRWWEGQLAAALWCLDKSIIQLVDEVKKNWTWHGEFIGIHIRRTDRQQLLGITPNVYLEAALQLQGLHPHLKRVFLATDEPTTVLPELEKYPTLEIFTLANATMDYGLYRRPGAVGIETVTLQAILDLELLATTQYFIGAQRSAFAWLATRLQLGRGNQLACPIFVDRPLSYAYGYWNGTGDLTCL